MLSIRLLIDFFKTKDRSLDCTNLQPLLRAMENHWPPCINLTSQPVPGVFPGMVISMVDVGEETGQLPEMLLKVADVYDDEVDNAVTALTSSLEPSMSVILALVVGSVVVAVFLPLIKVIQSVNG